MAFEAPFLEGQRPGTVAIGTLDLEKRLLIGLPSRSVWRFGHVKGVYTASQDGIQAFPLLESDVLFECVGQTVA